MILESSLHFGVLKCRLLFDGRENSGAGCAVSAAPCLADFGNTVFADGQSSLHFSPIKVQAAFLNCRIIGEVCMALRRHTHALWRGVPYESSLHFNSA